MAETSVDRGKRRAGVRTAYDAMPHRILAWVEHRLGSPVAQVLPRTGGMSPAVAATVIGADGARVFVKAVSADINPDTPTHFRHELTVLSAIGPAPYRSQLLDSFDDGHWVALLLEDVDGQHPDWDDPAQVDAVFDAVTAQTRELTPLPAGLEIDTVGHVLERHQTLLLAEPPSELVARLPRWAQDGYDDVMAMVRDAPPVDGDTLCHWDVRHDNLLIRRADGQVVTVDWGMSRRGPWWGDVFVMALEWAESELFDDLLARAGLDDHEQHDATRVLASVGCYLVMSSGLPAPPGLPHLPEFRAELGGRCLAGVRRRLDTAGSPF